MTLTWEEAEVAALDRSEWRRSVAQCIHLDAGWIKVKVKVYGSLEKMVALAVDNVTNDAVLELLNSVDKSVSVSTLNKPRGLFHANGGNYCYRLSFWNWNYILNLVVAWVGLLGSYETAHRTALDLQSTRLNIDLINTGHYKNLNTIGKQNYQEPGVEAELNFEFFESYHFIF